MAGKFIIALVCLSALSPSSALVWDSLKVTFSSANPVPPNSFFDLPLTVPQAVQEGWVEPEETKSDNLTQTYCMKDDPRICIIYDQQGSIAGYQIGITKQVDELRDVLKVHPLDKSFEEVTLFGYKMYVTKMYFVPQDVIQSGGRSNADTTGTGLWLNIKGELVEIPRKESELKDAVPAYVKQNCFFRMGQHYFYNASKTMQPDGYQPFFILYSDDGELQGLGMVMFGSNADGDLFAGKRGWFEPLVSAAVRMISPDTPDWVLKTIDDYGVYSHHIYMIREPYNLVCKANQPKGKY